MVAQTDQLLQRLADGRSNRWGRDRLRQFRRRWGAADAAGDADATRRVLVIDEALPRAGHDAGSNAILSHMRALQSLGYAVSLVAASGLEAPRDQVAALETLGIEVWAAPFYASVEDVLRRQSDCFDVVYLHRAAIASRYMALARAHQPRARIVYAVADLHHLRLERQAVVEGRPELLAASRRVGMEERMHAWMADAVITHSATEAALLRNAVPEASVHHVAWDVPVRRPAASWSGRHGVAFIGSYDHAPNLDGAAWLTEAVMPLVWQSEPGLTCFLAGSNMPASVRNLAQPGIEAIGPIADLGALFNRVRLTVAPLRFGAGLKGKVLDSLAAGLPCAMTEMAAEGTGLPSDLQPLVARDGPSLAALIVRLHRDQALNDALSEAGTAWIGQTFAPAVIAAGLQAAMGVPGPARAGAATPPATSARSSKRPA